MSLFVHLPDSSGLPRYCQIERQIRAAIAGGVIRPGEQVPAIRELAARLTVNPATVIQAYDVLERDGLIVRRHGSGTYVAEIIPEMSGRERERRAVDVLEPALNQVRNLGLSASEIRVIVRKLLGAEPKTGRAGLKTKGVDRR